MHMSRRYEHARQRVDGHMIGREPERTLGDHHRSIRLVNVLFLKLIDSFGSDGEGLIRR